MEALATFDLNEEDIPENILAVAARNTSLQALDYLLDSGLDPDSFITDSYRGELMHDASVMAVETLLDHGLTVGRNQLRTALKNRRRELARALLRHGVEPDYGTFINIFNRQDQKLIKLALKSNPSVLNDNGSDLIEYIEKRHHPDRLIALFTAMKATGVLFTIEQFERLQRSFPEHARRFKSMLTPRQRQALNIASHTTA